MGLAVALLGAILVVVLGMACLERLPLDQPVRVSVGSGDTTEPEGEPLSNRHRKGPRYTVNAMRFIGACLVMIAAGLVLFVAWALLQAYQ